MQAAIVVPIYYNTFSDTEKCSLQQCLKIFSNYPIIFVIPDDLKIENDLQENDNISYQRVPSKWMSSIDEYSKMCCSIAFYDRFIQYDYILIYQLDAFVFKDELLRFCNMGYDYYGAPWIKGSDYKNRNGGAKIYVGNGGFSLRKTSSCIELLQGRKYAGEPEDVFWAKCDSPDFRVAPVDIALQFSFEMNAYECYLMNDCQLPFGCHAWNKLNLRFWRPFFEELGYSLDGMEETFEKQFTWICWNLSKKCLLECTELDKFSEKPIYIWGTKEDGIECGFLLKKMGINSFLYIDSNENSCMKPLWGKPVCLPNTVNINEESIVIIAAKRYEKEILLCLEEKGVDINEKVISYYKIVDKIEKFIFDKWNRDNPQSKEV